MEGMELICFQIISTVGTARSLYIEAIHEAKVGHFDEARAMIKEGGDVFVEGHHSHMQLLQNEALGNKTEVGLLLIHAEDQLMSAEGFGILAEEFVDLYEQLSKKA
jgi:PTS system cellobiose-specific IIA component